MWSVILILRKKKFPSRKYESGNGGTKVDLGSATYNCNANLAASSLKTERTERLIMIHSIDVLKQYNFQHASLFTYNSLGSCP